MTVTHDLSEKEVAEWVDAGIAEEQVPSERQEEE
jgi:hypothetical protein